MTVIDQARQAIFALSDLASGSPDPVSVLKVQADLVRLHLLVGEEMTRRFGAKERSYLSRKIAEAKEYRANRFDTDGKARKPAADASRDAELAVGEEYLRQIEDEETYEGYRTLLKSLQNAFEASRSLVSFYKQAEGNA